MLDVDAVLSGLTLDEKAALLAGADTWRTPAVERLGVPAVKMTDGPNGARGSRRTRGVTVPCGSALGATWDPDLVERIGRLLGTEARRRHAHVLLAPTVNLHRTPYGGRNFECYSEDPELTARLAVGFVRGVQSAGVAATVKHLVANDSEIDRLTTDTVVPERALRELYLRPFEAAVREAGAWAVMPAYNRLHGDFCAQSHWLLTEVLRDGWGFDGVAVSDWFGAHDTVPAARAGLGVEMPGPPRVFGPHLADAVRAGHVEEATVDARVTELLRLIERTGAVGRPADDDEESVDDPAERALCREAAAASVVLLANRDDTLPLDPARLARVAVIGPNADRDQSVGGGSASLRPLTRRTILDALTDRLAGRAEVVHEPGVWTDEMAPVLDGDLVRRPDGAPGLTLTLYEAPTPGGEAHSVEDRSDGLITFFGETDSGLDVSRRFSFEAEGTLRAPVDGTYRLTVVTTGRVRLTLGDDVLVDDTGGERLPRGDAFFGLGSVETGVDVELRAGEERVLRAAWSARTAGFAALRLGCRPPRPADGIDRAGAAAAAADCAVVVVGTTAEWETEGEDRSTIRLPGGQDELVRRVAAANPNTVVVVNAGAPVACDWVDDVGAALVCWFGGMEMAEAVTDVLLGDAEPGGRLPVTFPVRDGDHPARLSYPGEQGRSVYGEGLFVGYRGYEERDLSPRFPFGHGGSYTTFAWSDARLSSAEVAAGEGVAVAVDVTNTGDRTGSEVVQVYVAAPEATLRRPPKELRGFAKVTVDPGATVTAEVALDGRALAAWDVAAGGWRVEPGRYEIVVAASSADVRARLNLTVEAADAG